MRDVHAELSELRMDWPETPDVATAVAARLAASADGTERRSPRRRRRAGWRPALAYGLAALAAAFAVTMAASPDARSAVLELLGLKHVRIERQEPVAPPPRPGTLGAGLGLGTPVTLAQARADAPFLSLPGADGLGEPDAVYVGRDSAALVYGARTGYVPAAETGAALLVQEFQGRVGQYIQKTVGSAAGLERLRVDGAPAYFITGSHGFAYEDDEGVTFEDERLAGNTLLVERADGLLIRIEGDLARDRAVAVARSIP
jgi:hypothetical protein